MWILHILLKQNIASITGSRQQASAALIFPAIRQILRCVNTEDGKRLGDSIYEMLFMKSSIKKLTLQQALCSLQRHTYTYLHTYFHTHVYTYALVCIYVCTNIGVFALTSLLFIISQFWHCSAQWGALKNAIFITPSEEMSWCCSFPLLWQFHFWWRGFCGN